MDETEERKISYFNRYMLNFNEKPILFVLLTSLNCLQKVLEILINKLKSKFKQKLKNEHLYPVDIENLVGNEVWDMNFRAKDENNISTKLYKDVVFNENEAKYALNIFTYNKTTMYFVNMFNICWLLSVLYIRRENDGI